MAQECAPRLRISTSDKRHLFCDGMAIKCNVEKSVFTPRDDEKREKKKRRQTEAHGRKEYKKKEDGLIAAENRERYGQH